MIYGVALNWSVVPGFVVLAALACLAVFVLAILVGLGWRLGRGQLVVAYYEIGKGYELAKVRYDRQTGTMVIKYPPVCSVCAEKRRLAELHDQLNDPEEHL